MLHVDPLAALLLIDVQEGFDDPSWGSRNNADAEGHILELLTAWREAAMPLFHVQHISIEPDSVLADGKPGVELKVSTAPRSAEPLVKKNVNSAFIGTNLESMLRAAKVSTVVIVGLTTDHCVSTTVRMAANLGFKTVLVADATATFERVGHDGAHWSAQQMHDAALASLSGEFAHVVGTEEVLSALAGTRHPRQLKKPVVTREYW